MTPNMTYIVQLNVDGAGKPHAEFGKHILHAVWGASGRWGRTAKIVIVVGPDVDPVRHGLRSSGPSRRACSLRRIRSSMNPARPSSSIRRHPRGTTVSGRRFADRHRRDDESAGAFRDLPGSQPADAEEGAIDRGQAEGRRWELSEPPSGCGATRMQLTLAQKILARAAGRERRRRVTPGEIVTCKVDLALLLDSGGPRRIWPRLKELGVGVWDPGQDRARAPIISRRPSMPRRPRS